MKIQDLETLLIEIAQVRNDDWVTLQSHILWVFCEITKAAQACLPHVSLQDKAHLLEEALKKLEKI